MDSDRRQKMLMWAVKVSELLTLDDDSSTMPVANCAPLIGEILRYLNHRQREQPYDLGQDTPDGIPFRPHHLLEWLLASGIRGHRLLDSINSDNIPRSVDDLVARYGAALQRRREIAEKCPKFKRLSEVHTYCKARGALPPDDPDYVLRLVEKLSPEDPKRAIIRLRLTVDGERHMMGAEVEKDVPINPVRPVFSMTEEESNAQRNLAVALAELLVDEVLMDLRRINKRHHWKCFVATSVVLESNIVSLLSEFEGASHQERMQYVGYSSLVVLRMCKAFSREPEALEDWLRFCEVMRLQGQDLPVTFQSSLRVRTNLGEYVNYLGMMECRSEAEQKGELNLADLSKAALKVVMQTNGLTLAGIIKTFFAHWTDDFPDRTREDVNQFVAAVSAVPRPLELQGPHIPGASDPDLDRRMELYLRSQVRACMDLFMYKTHRTFASEGELAAHHPWHKQKVRRSMPAGKRPAVGSPESALQERLVIDE